MKYKFLCEKSDLQLQKNLAGTSSASKVFDELELASCLVCPRMHFSSEVEDSPQLLIPGVFCAVPGVFAAVTACPASQCGATASSLHASVLGDSESGGR